VLEDLQCNTHISARGPDAICDAFADYFQSAGELPWQYTKNLGVRLTNEKTLHNFMIQILSLRM
jgi:hypothetical protein